MTRRHILTHSLTHPIPHSLSHTQVTPLLSLLSAYRRKRSAGCDGDEEAVAVAAISAKTLSANCPSVASLSQSPSNVFGSVDSGASSSSAIISAAPFTDRLPVPARVYFVSAL